MSRRKPARGILGPDGKPIDRAKYAPAPAPTGDSFGAEHVEAARRSLRRQSGRIVSYGGVNLGMLSWPALMQAMVDGSVDVTEVRPKPRTLADRVAADLAALTGDLDFVGRPELPQRKADPSRYEDALAEAVRTCPHEYLEDTLHAAGQFRCLDCDQYLTRREVVDARRRASGYGWGS